MEIAKFVLGDVRISRKKQKNKVVTQKKKKKIQLQSKMKWLWKNRIIIIKNKMFVWLGKIILVGVRIYALFFFSSIFQATTLKIINTYFGKWNDSWTIQTTIRFKFFQSTFNNYETLNFFCETSSNSKHGTRKFRNVSYF